MAKKEMKATEAKEVKTMGNMSEEAKEALKSTMDFDREETQGQDSTKAQTEIQESKEVQETAKGSPVNLPKIVGADEKQKALETKKKMQEYKKRSGIIRKQVGNIENSFLIIAFQLHWIKATEMYKTSGAKNIYEYAENEFSLGKTTCCNLICIVENFAKRKDDGSIIEEIEECYKNFKASQLVAMIGMEDAERKKVTPDMSVRAINEMRRQAQSLGTSTGDSRQEEKAGKKGKEKQVIENVLMYFNDYQKYQRELEEMDALIERAFKKSTVPIKIKIVCEQEI